MDTRLKDLIEIVARRMRRQRFIWLIAPVCLLTASVGFLLLSQHRQGELSQSTAQLGTIISLGVLLIVAIIVSLCSFRNLKKVALRIEERFPKLNQRLLTAVDQRPEHSDESLTYLQTAVIDDAIRHGKTHRWSFAVNDGFTRIAWILNVPAILLLLLVGLNLTSVSAKANNRKKLDSGLAETSKNVGIKIEPGDAEIERGTNLVVVARFDDTDESVIPSSVSLISKSGDSEKQIEMSRNLKDPVFGGYLNEITEDTIYKVQYNDEATREYKIAVFEYPRLDRSDAKLEFPGYTGLSDKLVEDTRRIVAVEGSELTWIFHLNKPVAVAELISEDEQSIPLEAVAGSPNEYRITIGLEKTTRWALKLTDDKGRENKYPPELIARVSPNKPPVLKLVAARDVRVSPLEELEVGASFQDDFGMKEFGISYAMAGSENKAIVLGESTKRKEKREVIEMIDFEALNAQPDQLLSYYFWAEDVDPNGNSRQVQSDMFFAEVRHFEEIFRQGQQKPEQEQQQQQQSQNGQEAEELAELQKQIITGTWNLIRRGPEQTENQEFLDNTNLLRESQETAIAQLEELAKNVSDGQSISYVDAVREFMQKAITELASVASDKDHEKLKTAMSVEQAAYQGLLKLRAREFEVSQQQQSQSKSQSKQNQQRRQQFEQQLNELELKNDENRYESEQQAQEEEDQQAREMRQILNRLKELAQRQEDINKQLKQLQSALEEAETDEEREEIERQLKRLREEQQELLRDTDELTDRMDQPENQEALSEQQEQLAETRENVRQSSEALSENQVSQALSAGTRAEREFKRMRDDVREKAASEFEETMREMREKARELDGQQKELGKQIADLKTENSGSLRSPKDRDEIRDSVNQQQAKLGELLRDMEQTVEEAELSEPLLAENLYDSFRKTRQRQVEQKLKTASQLLERGLDPQASEMEESAREGITKLRQEIEKASENVLGDPAESLRRALSELDEISKQLNREIQQNDPGGEPQEHSSATGQSSESEPSEQKGQGKREEQTGEQEGIAQLEGQEQQKGNERMQPGKGSPNQNQQPQDSSTPGANAESPLPQNQPAGEGQPNEQSGNPQAQEGQQPGQGQPKPGQPQGESQPDRRASESQESSAEQNGQPQSNQQNGSRQSQNGQPQQNAGAIDQFANNANQGAAAPLTGEGYREWTDRLRDVEEMVEDPELRSRATQIREAARDVRIELKRHSNTPQWDLVRIMIAKPLEELKQEVSDELLRRSADRNALVPIDRDPVPKQFADQVRKYYEKLGSGK